MIKTLLVLGTGAGLVVAAAAASAGTCTTEIERLQKQLSSSDAGMSPTGTIAETGQLLPPTETMNQAVQGKATSPEDVLRQNQGEPTDADAAAAGQLGTAAGTAEAGEALQRARQLDQAGHEAACLTAIDKVQTQLRVD